MSLQQQSRLRYSFENGSGLNDEAYREALVATWRYRRARERWWWRRRVPDRRQRRPGRVRAVPSRRTILPRDVGETHCHAKRRHASRRARSRRIAGVRRIAVRSGAREVGRDEAGPTTGVARAAVLVGAAAGISSWTGRRSWICWTVAVRQPRAVRRRRSRGKGCDPSRGLGGSVLLSAMNEALRS